MCEPNYFSLNHTAVEETESFAFWRCVNTFQKFHVFLQTAISLKVHTYMVFLTNTPTLVTGNICPLCVSWPTFLYLCLYVWILWHCLSVVVPVCVSVHVHSYLLHIASASSEPSAHSGSPSQRHRAGTHCPFLQAKSVVAQVFFAVEKKVYLLCDSNRSKAVCCGSLLTIKVNQLFPSSQHIIGVLGQISWNTECDVWIELFTNRTAISSWIYTDVWHFAI